MPSVAAEVTPREKILDAAEALFARRGFAGVGLSEIADAVSLSKSSLFHHFPTKAQLYAAVVERILHEMETALMRALAAGGTPVERLDRWVDTIVDILGSRPSHARLLLRSLFEDDELTGSSDEERAANEALERIIHAASQLMREGMTTGALRAASIPHTLQSVIGMIIYHFASGDFGTEMLGRSVFDPAEVKRRKDDIKALLHHGLVTRGGAQEGE